MSDPDGQLSGVPPAESRLKQSSNGHEFADLLPDPSQYFEVWLEDLKPKREPNTSHQFGQPAVAEQPTPGVFRFEGILRVDGYASGSLRSLKGTLIVGESGEVESDIMVGTAIIDGFLRGDIHATERVELGSHAKVFGNIKSPALSIQTGAVFEGECHFLPSPYKESDEDNGQMQSGSSMFSRPLTQGSPGVNHEAGEEEEAEALAVAAG